MSKLRFDTPMGRVRRKDIVRTTGETLFGEQSHLQSAPTLPSRLLCLMFCGSGLYPRKPYCSAEAPKRFCIAQSRKGAKKSEKSVGLILIGEGQSACRAIQDSKFQIPS